MITKAEKKAAEIAARALYQDVLKVEVKEDPDNESSLILRVTRGAVMPDLTVNRKTMQPERNRRKG